MPEEVKTVEINGVRFTPIPGIKYPHNYLKLAAKIAEKPEDELSWYRELVRIDLFFIVLFVMKVPGANHPFVIQACKDVMDGPKSHTLELWFRGGYKSTIITIAENIRDIVNNPEERICILSYTRPSAISFLRTIKQILESSELMLKCFPDVLYEKPESEAFRWSEEAGLYVRRKSFSKEATVEAWGLIDGMPTRQHYTKIVYDDIVTVDMVDNPEMLEKAKTRFDMSLSLQSTEARVRIVGTTYHHEDVLMYIKEKKDADGKPIYQCRVKPATVNGLSNGASVLLPEEKLTEYRANTRIFRSQYLLDPTPRDECKLESNHLVDVLPNKIPSKLYKFMVVDPAGSAEGKDSWAMHVIGVDPFINDLGASDIFILDSLIEPMDLYRAMDEVVRMYQRAGRVIKLGVEKVGSMTMEIHVAAALRAKGRILSIEAGSLVVLRPAGRSKEIRIESLAWPLRNGKIHVSSAVPSAYRERLKLEMQKFPYWHDDGLDALSYVYDIIKDYRFWKRAAVEEKRDAWEGETHLNRITQDGWMIV